MMNETMHGGSAFWGMGTGMGISMAISMAITWILVLLLLGLGIAALIKYLRS